MVTVHFDVSGNQATLCVSDNGVGYDASQAPSSMGRQLMGAFAQQLGGEKSVTSSAAGTQVTMRYPFDLPGVNAAAALPQ